MGEHVAVPLIDLEPGMREALQADPGMMKTEMRIIQRLRRIQRRLPDEGGELDQVDGMTIEEAKEKLIRDRIEEMRPQASWKAIAKSLGIAEKTLWVKRKELGYTCD